MSFTVIDLNPRDFECHICGREDSYGSTGGFGIPIYEDAIVPDDYEGEWGGVPVCARCFYLTRGVQEAHPRQLITMSLIRRLAHADT